MRQNLEYFATLFFIKIGKILPKKALYGFLDFVAVLLFWILKSRRRLAVNNLKMAFGLDDDKATQIAKNSFKSIAISLGDCLLLMNGRAEVDEFFADPQKEKIKVEKALENVENGVIFFTAHFGNWEILTQFVAKMGYPQLVITREGNNELIEKRITMPFRRQFDNEFAYKNEAMIKIVKKLKNKGRVGLLTDLKASGTNSVKVPFFGRLAHSTKAVGELYLKYQPKIIPIFAKRLNNGKYEIEIMEFIPPKLGENKDENVKNIVEISNKYYEKIISENKEQWFWMHNRWKQDE